MKRALLLLALACSGMPTKGDAAAIVARELAVPQGIELVLDDETHEIFENGRRSGRLGSCRRLPGGSREVTIYVARHETLESLEATIRHELDHAARSCSNSDH